jgi:hypothetical protein
MAPHPLLSLLQPRYILFNDGDTSSIAGVANQSVVTGTNNEFKDTGIDQIKAN